MPLVALIASSYQSHRVRPRIQTFELVVLLIVGASTGGVAATAFVDNCFLIRTYILCFRYGKRILRNWKKSWCFKCSVHVFFFAVFLSRISFTESQFSIRGLYNNNKFSPTLIGEEIFKCLKFNQFSCEVELFDIQKSASD